MKSIEFDIKLLDESNIKQFFEIWRETMVRSRLPISIVFLKQVTVAADRSSEIGNEHILLNHFLHSQIRKNDLLFQLTDKNHWGLLFYQSSALEAEAFLNRIFTLLKKDHPIIALKASITEIRNNEVTFETVINQNKQLLADDEQESWSIYEIKDYSVPPIEVIKVSIIEQNDIFRKVLETTINQLSVHNYTFEVTTYQDGYSFLENDQYKSAHTHLIIMNDIMPRKNGLEILHILRNMPNNKKFIVYMMSERNSEQSILTAYESGVDEYISKPFNLRLLEAKIKRTFARFWL